MSSLADSGTGVAEVVSHAVDGAETVYYATLLSNLVRGYDKYTRVYDKSKIPESTYPERFFLLTFSELAIGIDKASGLLKRTGVTGDRILVLETRITAELHPNLRNGLGRFVDRGWVVVDAVNFVEDAGALIALRIEEAYSLSLRLHLKGEKSYEGLTPRSISILPIAKACQAKCPFCFSRASVSADIRHDRIDWERVSQVLERGRLRGAERVVITGGGEPTLVGDDDLVHLISKSASVFSKVVLISNGYHWGRMSQVMRYTSLRRLDSAGLKVLSISRHHFDSDANAAIMHLKTESGEIAKTLDEARSHFDRLRLRWICVLQRGGIENRELLEQYLNWAVESGMTEVCFKELYVSSSIESEYYDRSANEWSAEKQVSLRLVTDLARDLEWTLVKTLPWGAPIFEGEWRGRTMRVAAYTEPSLYWELSNGICRSWNLMADGRCLASLEDRSSEVLHRELCELQTTSR